MSATVTTDSLAFARLAQARRWYLLELHGLSETEDGKRPIGDDWQNKGKLAAEGRVGTWRERGSNAGLLPGLSGVAVLDVEPAGLATWPRQRFPAGALLVRTPSGGLHVYLVLEAVERVLGREIGKLKLPGAELFGRVGQVAIPPSRARSRKALDPATGRYDAVRVGEYVLEQMGEPIADEALLRELLAPFAAEAGRRNGRHEPAPTRAGVTTPYGRRALARAVLAITGAAQGSRQDTFLREGAAMFSLVAGGELDQAEAERELDNAYHVALPDELDDLGRRMVWARERGLASPRSARSPRSVATPAAESETGPSERSANGHGDAAAAKSQPVPCAPAFRWYAPHALPERDPDLDLVRDFIAPGEVACLAGASGSGKSFLALDLALAVAGDRETFLGQRVQRHGVALYMAGEGFSGLRARVLAADPDGKATARLRFAATVPTLLDSNSVQATLDAARKLIADEFAGEAPLLLVLDTFAQAVAGADENDNGAMGAAARAAASFARELGAAVLLVHHAKKSRQAGESFLRGASSLLCALDAAWGIERVAGNDLARIITCEKQKDRPSDGAWRVELAPVSVGKGETLHVALAASVSSTERERMEARKAAALRILRRDSILALLAPFPAGINPRELREKLIRRGFALSDHGLRDVLDKMRADELLDVRGLAQARRVFLTSKGQALARRLADQDGIALDPVVYGLRGPAPSGGHEKAGLEEENGPGDPEKPGPEVDFASERP